MEVWYSSYISNSENKFRHFKQIFVQSRSSTRPVYYLYIYTIKKDILNVDEYKSF